MLFSEIVCSNLSLRNIFPNQVSNEYVSWLNNPDINRFLEVRHQVNNLETQKKFIEDVNESSDSSIFGIFLDHSIMVGTIKLGPINSIHRTAHIGIMIGAKEHHGKGIATTAISGLCKALEKTTLVRKVNAGVVSENLGSIRAFEKNGFILEGVSREQFLNENGLPLDVILLGKILNSAW
jgi:ribosomal-protein-alanine N-acetyltransferase